MVKKPGHEYFHSTYKTDANYQSSFIKLLRIHGSGVKRKDVNRDIKFNCLIWLASQIDKNNWFKTQHGGMEKAWAFG